MLNSGDTREPKTAPLFPTLGYVRQNRCVFSLDEMLRLQVHLTHNGLSNGQLPIKMCGKLKPAENRLCNSVGIRIVFLSNPTPKGPIRVPIRGSQPFGPRARLPFRPGRCRWPSSPAQAVTGQNGCVFVWGNPFLVGFYRETKAGVPPFLGAHYFKTTHGVLGRN